MNPFLRLSLKNRVLSTILLWGLPLPVFATSPTWKEVKDRDDPTLFPITQFLETPSQKKYVVIAGGMSSGILKGMTLHTLRAAPGALLEGTSLKFLPYQPPKALASKTAEKILWIQTGILKAIEVQHQYTIAQVVTQGSDLASAFFPEFPGIMVGDLASIPELRLSRTPTIVPTLNLTYNSLFEDPKQNPATFELSAAGLVKLKEAATQIASAKLSLLMIEGYTDHQGKAEENQRESYQRALTVRQILIDDFGFDPSRLVAVGYGEIEPDDDTLAPGYVDRNRRIVLKPVPIGETASFP